MKKYESHHFSPSNNRSILMPETSKKETRVSDKKIENAFQPVPEEQVRKDKPYFQPNVGYHEKEIDIAGKGRHYAMYVPDGILSKAAAVVIFPDSGIKAKKFLEKRNWGDLAERYHTILIVLESSKWDANNVDSEFDYVWTVIRQEFKERWTADICEAYMYPIGYGEGAYMASAFAITYSATFPAFAADGNCNIEDELLERLRQLPSDGIGTKKKPDIPISGFVIDRSGKGEAFTEYLKGTINAREDGLKNAFGQVYLERPRAGAYFINEQPVSQVWLGEPEKTGRKSREELDEEMLKFVLRFARWGGSGNNHLRLRQSLEETGILRIEKEIQGLKRYWDVFVPSCYRQDDGKEYPLVVAIHGFSCNSEYFEQTSDWCRIAEERGFFVVFASAYPRNVGRSRFPLPGWCVWPIDEEGIDETIYFKELLDDMEETFHIDQTRVYAVGHSNGGRMTQRLMRKMPERFAAFSPTGALGGNSADEIEPIGDEIECPVWFMMGEFDLKSPEVREGSIAEATLETYCQANHMNAQYENWYDNGRYHTLVMYNDAHVPMVKYTIIKGCPHTYTAEMAQMTWDEFLCHFSRKEDGSIKYDG